jgi:endoglucanase
LFTVTKDAKYIPDIKKYAAHVGISDFGWADNAGFGTLACLFDLRSALDKDFIDNLQSRFLKSADHFLYLANKSGYGVSLADDNWIWGSILPIMNHGIAMLCAKLLTGDAKYEEAALKQLDYLLGVNATGYSFVTGFGEKAFRFPHHRPSYADGVDAPVPGMVSGGPNARNPDGGGQLAIPPETPPAKFWLDYTGTAGANEIAIYWNSPAVFVAGYFCR